MNAILFVYIEQTNELIDTVVSDTILDCYFIATGRYPTTDYRFRVKDLEDIPVCELIEPLDENKITTIRYFGPDNVREFLCIEGHNSFFGNIAPQAVHDKMIYIMGTRNVRRVLVNRQSKETQISNKVTGNRLLSIVRRLIQRLLCR